MPNAHRRAMAFDYGTRQIGVAVGQTLTGNAEPLTNLRARDGVPDWDQLARLIREWEPNVLVVGLPLNMDGSASDMSERAARFARRLNGRFQLPVETVDERLSTFEAKQHLKDQGRTPSSYRDDPVDSLAAALLLQTWLSSQSKET
ncbi:Holliday junction resolvase RuvX [Halopseudomonas pachastrellae]|jgi:putative Holliday junction resolvase|uniref:Putative pre-16S rRNA nuclease n=1 Tax=Halopseudomonas pachastrellae TaxID=254161 RepID=A0A1S8DKI6_9GAMM|nr:Holliday junction resolvase RuvX [Halopseudomonas pachastrellae]MED5492151.1 Holliday junction resolvase RuvX [Pseudomonadota bacterium]MEB3734163.1 Holliday junction resolvase RuvX [Halopseudomonas pachastrellae]ONM45172.1 Holliday junction resolvase RuvX [Halopseudomonas pachastrellae]WVM90530.1 Holliday junction resolvase RuvX [Halopseudomonas pachastrellae]WVM91900.1 Holliday junction resolvase RuvX [Halopseudomonas pachastrellae]